MVIVYYKYNKILKDIIIIYYIIDRYYYVDIIIFIVFIKAEHELTAKY